MNLEKLVKEVISYMENWMILSKSGDEITLYPATGKIIGRYPKDFKIKVVAEDG